MTTEASTDPGEQSVARGVALVRLLALPLAVATEALVSRPTTDPDGFELAIATGGLYACGALLCSLRWPAPPPIAWRGLTAADLGLAASLAYFSGGPFSQIQYALLLIPLGVAILGRPREAALAAAASLCAYVLLAVVHPGFDSPGAHAFVVAQALLLLWTGALVLVVARLLAERNANTIRLSEGRQLLVAQALEAEERERRRLANELHDDAVQNLLAAQIELGRAQRGDPDGLGLAQAAVRDTVAKLRTAIFDLHPPSLTHVRLTQALEEVAQHYANRAGLAVRIDIEDPADHTHDQLIFSVARELLTNAAKHAHAAHVALSLTTEDDHVLLEVADDGVGFDPAVADIKRQGGHIGLTSSRERIAALGGSLYIDSRRGQGTRIVVCLPAPSEQSEYLSRAQAA